MVERSGKSVPTFHLEALWSYSTMLISGRRDLVLSLDFFGPLRSEIAVSQVTPWRRRPKGCLVL